MCYLELRKDNSVQYNNKQISHSLWCKYETVIFCVDVCFYFQKSRHARKIHNLITIIVDWKVQRTLSGFLP